MNCPKCGAEHDGSDKECLSCGIVFARWQAREPRQRSAAGAAARKHPGLSTTAFVLIALVLAIGIPFVLRSLYLRFRPLSIQPRMITPAAQIDEQAAWKFQSDQQRRNIRERNGASSDRAPDLPGDIDRARMLSLLQDCRYFQTPVSVEIPKRFMASLQDSRNYRPIAAAQLAHLIVFDKDPVLARGSDTIGVRIDPAAYSIVDVFETDNSIRFTLGRRKPEVTSAWGKSESTASATFTWTFEHEKAAGLAGDPDERKGYADFERWNLVWTISSAWKDTKPPDTICP